MLSDDLDALLYPELGMESGLLPLAALRLARRQAMAWGHPVTSGIPAMDLFLSSDWMEPADGASRLSEALVRLPGSSLALRRPGPGSSPPPLPPGPLALCAQSLFKLRPQDDQLWARLAECAPQARLLFIAHPSSALTERFRSRLQRAFSLRGLSLDRHVHLLPRLDEATFSALQRSVDLWLDSPGWSGGMTALEAIGAGLPLLTAPEGPMRSRHSAGLLQGMGCGEGVCADHAALVSRAATLLAEPELRALHAQRCMERSSLLYDQPAPVDALLQALLGA
jgi:predicted O-linked N-acetylglucosamine transferase (SPINDLY family)